MSKEYYSVNAFAKKVGRTPNAIYLLLTKGNRYRKLKATKVDGHWHIPASELTEFPFTTADAILGEFKETVRLLQERVDKLEAKVDGI